MNLLRVGTRGSDLAQAQTGSVCAALRALVVDLRVEVITIATVGDLHPEMAIGEGWPVGGFTGAIEQALLDGRIDLAVHSLKDLPVLDTPGLVIAATPRREVPGDVLVSAGPVAIDRLPSGFRLGTSSPRRAAQWRHVAPGAEIVPIRGNVPTRLAKVGREVDGVVLAAAGLRRLGARPAHMVELPDEVFLPAPGQGALAVQVREDRAALRELVAAMHDDATWREVRGERAFLARLGTGCGTPAAALGRAATGAGRGLRLHGQLFTADGSRMERAVLDGDDPETTGAALAVHLRGKLEARCGSG